MENRNWVELPIKDVAVKLTSGGTPSTKKSEYYENGDIPWLNTKEVDYNRITSTEKYITEEGLKNSSAKWIEENSVIVAMYGATAAKTAITKIPLTTNQACCNIIVNHEVCDYEFLFYNISNKYSELENIAVGAAQQNLSVGVIGNFILKFPPLPEQKAIASILSSLDDKIDLLHQQNQTLEALAETLFRQWFIVEAKEDWEVLPLSEIAEVKNGKSFKSSDFTDNDFNSYEVVKMGHIERGGGLKLNPKKDYVSREMDVEKWILNKGDIIMAMTDMKDNVVILGVPAMIDKDDHYVLNQRVARIYLKDNSKLISNYLLYIQLNNKDFIAELQTKANSGVQVNLSTEAIKESEVLIPPIELQKELGHKIIDLYSKIEINREQIQTLTQLRDTLLPKLMSGEVRVKV